MHVGLGVGTIVLDGYGECGYLLLGACSSRLVWASTAAWFVYIDIGGFMCLLLLLWSFVVLYLGVSLCGGFALCGMVSTLGTMLCLGVVLCTVIAMVILLGALAIKL